KLPRLQRIDDRAALVVVHHRPAGDLVDRALAADAHVALGIHDADALARRHDAPRRVARRRRIGHVLAALLAEFCELALQLIELALQAVDRVALLLGGWRGCRLRLR